MKFCGNIYDPSDPNADMYVIRGFDETQEDAVRRYKEWLQEKILSRPQATEKYSVEELESMRIVGVYDPNQEE